MLRHAYRGAWHVCLWLAQDMRCYQGQSHQNLRKGSSAAQLHGCCCGGDLPGCGATMVDMYAEIDKCVHAIAWQWEVLSSLDRICMHCCPCAGCRTQTWLRTGARILASECIAGF